MPFLPVKIGAGLPPYQLSLGRNVLWTGTMNQDETTKALSDKVLDRSIIIHFPRPTELKRRLKLSPLDEKNRGTPLHRATWESWWVKESSFSEDDVKPFKSFIQEMNNALAVAGRAIGHRVWQSIEYYMANYPDVRAAQKAVDRDALGKALHVAFEDQLVQKVMPKLRGIDTRERSRGKRSLDTILDQINLGIGGKPFNLKADFEDACELGYGQFIWQSANYLREDPSAPQAAAAATNAPAEIALVSPTLDNVAAISKRDASVQTPCVDLNEPPSMFRKGDPDRNLEWKKLTKKQKQMYWSSEMNAHSKTPEQ